MKSRSLGKVRKEVGKRDSLNKAGERANRGLLGEFRVKFLGFGKENSALRKRIFLRGAV